MKTILRHYVIDTFSLYLISLIASGLVFGKGLSTLLLSGVALTLVSLIAKPIINILLLPLNLITFGIFRWVAASVVIYLTTLLVPLFKVSGFYFSGFTSRWIDIPVINLHGIAAFIAFSFLLSVVTSAIYWLIK
jgi:putative membrane protein